MNVDNKKISTDEIKKIKENYIGMYYGLVSVNWGRGMTLGMAWQKGLEQMDGFIAGKTKMLNHPLNKEILKIHSEFRRDMAKEIMSSEYANEKLEPALAKSFIEYGTKRVKETKDYLNGMYQKYMPEKTDAKQSNTKSFDVAKQKTQQLMQQLIAQQFLKQRAA